MDRGNLKGAVLGLSSSVAGGLCPIYWKQIDVIHPMVILLYRVILVCLSMFIISLLAYGWKGTFRPLKQRGAVMHFAIVGLIMASNWGIYVWSVNSGRIVQASIGYFIMPLIVCLIGFVAYREPVTKSKIAGLIVVAIGVLVLIYVYDEFPTVAFAIAISYAVYTSAQKKAQVTAIQALFFQTLLIMPAFLAILIYIEAKGYGALAVANTAELITLSFAGWVTALPLILVLAGINSASLVVMGLTNYVGDAISLLVGVFVYREPMNMRQFGSLCIILIGIAIYTTGLIKAEKKTKRQIQER